MTVHQEVCQRVLGYARLYDRRISRLGTAIRFAQRSGELPRLIREASRCVDERATRHLYRDYRPDVGSGRAAWWYHAGFARYAICAKTAHETLGLTGEACRAVARASMLVDYPAMQQFEPDGVTEPDGGWCAWYLREVTPRIASAEGHARLAKCAADPAYRISGYLADSILSWRDGTSGYEGCSGCESFGWHRQHPEQWETLLSHAPQGNSGDGWAQVFPHERERAADLQRRGWNSIFRVDDSIYIKPANGQVGH